VRAGGARRSGAFEGETRRESAAGAALRRESTASPATSGSSASPRGPVGGFAEQPRSAPAQGELHVRVAVHEASSVELRGDEPSTTPETLRVAESEFLRAVQGGHDGDFSSIVARSMWKHTESLGDFADGQHAGSHGTSTSTSASEDSTDRGDASGLRAHGGVPAKEPRQGAPNQRDAAWRSLEVPLADRRAAAGGVDSGVLSAGRAAPFVDVLADSGLLSPAGDVSFGSGPSPLAHVDDAEDVGRLLRRASDDRAAPSANASRADAGSVHNLSDPRAAAAQRSPASGDSASRALGLLGGSPSSQPSSASPASSTAAPAGVAGASSASASSSAQPVPVPVRARVVHGAALAHAPAAAAGLSALSGSSVGVGGDRSASSVGAGLMAGSASAVAASVAGVAAGSGSGSASGGVSALGSRSGSVAGVGAVSGSHAFVNTVTVVGQQSQALSALGMSRGWLASVQSHSFDANSSTASSAESSSRAGSASASASILSAPAAAPEAPRHPSLSGAIDTSVHSGGARGNKLRDAASPTSLSVSATSDLVRASTGLRQALRSAADTSTAHASHAHGEPEVVPIEPPAGAAPHQRGGALMDDLTSAQPWLGDPWDAAQRDGQRQRAAARQLARVAAQPDARPRFAAPPHPVAAARDVWRGLVHVAVAVTRFAMENTASSFTSRLRARPTHAHAHMHAHTSSRSTWRISGNVDLISHSMRSISPPRNAMMSSV
jgi:hypothetical protein